MTSDRETALSMDGTLGLPSDRQPSEKLRESCVRVRSSLSQLLAVGTDGSSASNVAAIDRFLTTTLRQGAQLPPGELGSLVESFELFCLAGIRGVFQVEGMGRRGQLGFDAGQLVHAQVGDLTGESAAIEILSWADGVLVASHAPLPNKANIDVPWQSLLLRAEAWREGTA